MALATWLVESDENVTRLQSSEGVLEKRLEDWIGSRPELAADGVTWLARQLVFPDGTRLDLLGLTADDRWVVAELKAGEINHSTLMQALGYAVSLGSLDATELGGRLASNPWFASHVSEEDAKGARELLSAEEDQDDPRTVSILLIGTRRSPALDLSIEFLHQQGLLLAITSVTFDLFHTNDGQTLLVRDVDDVAVPPPPPQGGRSVSAIQASANERGVGPGFQQILDAASELRLPVKPWPRSITVTAWRRGNPTYLYVRPEENGRVHVVVDQGNLAAHAGVSPEALEALGKVHDFTNEEVAAWLPAFVDAIRNASVAEMASGEAPPAPEPQPED